MPVKLFHHLGVAIIRLFGDLDMEDVVRIKNLISTLCGDGCSQIVIDFERVQHINATGLGILADRLHFVRLGGGDMRLAGLNPYLQSVFELTGVKRAFRTFASVEEAVHSYGPAVAAA